MKIKAKVLTPKRHFRNCVKSVVRSVNEELDKASFGKPIKVPLALPADKRVVKAVIKIYRKAGWYVEEDTHEKAGVVALKFHHESPRAARPAGPADDIPTD